MAIASWCRGSQALSAMLSGYACFVSSAALTREGKGFNSEAIERFDLGSNTLNLNDIPCTMWMQAQEGICVNN